MSMNLCSACKNIFSSVEIFDRHRVGKHEYTYEEGLLVDADNGRRCLNVNEMQELGWKSDAQGYWYDPVRSARASVLRGRAVQP